jgi:UDP-N-acetylglucosamine acyltransferase
MASIHPTAIVDRGAEIAADVEIGPYCVIGPHVVIHEGCRLASHVNLTGHTSVGARTVIAPFASLGTPPQSVKYRGGRTRLVIGEECDIREHVTINTGTEDGGGVTEIGSHCFLLVGSHVGHDSHIGNNVTLANNAVLGGHVTVGDHSFLGGHAAVHQFVRLGEGVMISGVSGVAADVIPFAFAIGQRAVLDGLNVIGLRRRGCTRDDLHRLRRAYRTLFLDSGVFRERLAAVEQDFGADPLVGKVIAFIRSGNSRPLMLPFNTTRTTDQAGAASDAAS